MKNNKLHMEIQLKLDGNLYLDQVYLQIILNI